jgi:hypothetical protein
LETRLNPWKETFLLSILFPTCDDKSVTPLWGGFVFYISSHWLLLGSFLFGSGVSRPSYL